MLKSQFLHTVLLLLIFCPKHTKSENNIEQSKNTYIVHMDKSTMPASFSDHHNWYESSLQSISESAEVLYTYKHVVHGFSTRLTNQEADALSEQPGILSIIPERKYELHTTRTPYFLGLEVTLASLDRFSTNLPASVKESEVIIGVLDSGIWPEHESLDDTGFGPIPNRWKGECESGKNFNSSHCNRKLIGARFFYKGLEGVTGPINEEKESKSPRDDQGHGTHTLTTAAGSLVSGASLFGLAPGTARGMSPRARVASYKVCWRQGCYSSDIAAAIDKAIEDGVDILSMSLGSDLDEYYKDLTAIGAFIANSHGILVSISAGNSGPVPGQISNVAPWMLTVGAGTLDRDFPAYVKLGNMNTYTGSSLYRGVALLDTPLPLVYAGNVSNNSSKDNCEMNTLIPARVAGKIVLCKRGGNGRVAKGLEVKRAGGIGMLLGNTKQHGEELVADPHVLPAASLGLKASDAIRDYILSYPNATATVSFLGTHLQAHPSPVVAAFSSRGPNPLTPKVLKPDLIGPGVNILAGWTGANGPSGLEEDTRRTSFNIMSGTSMSCPHISGLAAILKAAHPEWSPAAIRSALMTTSYTTYTNGNPILDIATQKPATPFDFGAGHVDPLQALDPGLVYDADLHDYLNFLCALNYNQSQIKAVARKEFTCDPRKIYRVEDLNYPSFAVPFESKNASNSVQYTRTLTNVGTPGTYKASVSFQQDSLVKIVVEPETLDFTELFEKKNYTVTFTSSISIPFGTQSFTYLKWSDGKHKVVSPIAFTWLD